MQIWSKRSILSKAKNSICTPENGPFLQEDQNKKPLNNVYQSNFWDKSLLTFFEICDRNQPEKFKNSA
jgi:hypothetical protein